MKIDRTRYTQLLRGAEKHPIEKVGARLPRHDGLAGKNIKLRPRCRVGSTQHRPIVGVFGLSPRTVT